MPNKPQFDIDEVLSLLTIPEKVANTAPRFTHISGEAMARLEKIEMGLVNAKREEQGLPPIPDPMVTGAARSSQTGAEGEGANDPKPSEPVDDPKSKVAAKAVPNQQAADAEAEKQGFNVPAADNATDATEVRRL